MSSPGLFQFPVGDVDFCYETEDVFGFADRKHHKMPSDAGLPMETPQLQFVAAHAHLDFDVDFDSEEPYIFGEPLNPATNFAWDLPEAKFRKAIQIQRESLPRVSTSRNGASSRHLPDLSDADSSLHQQLPVHTLRVTVSESENNPNSKARLGAKELRAIGQETNMHPGRGVAPEFMKRSSLGAFGPVVTRIKKGRRDTAKDSTERGRAGGANNSHGHGNADLPKNRQVSASTGLQDDATRLGLLQMDVVLE